MKKAVLLALGLCAAAGAVQADEKLVIAHRGASGYLPEHTLEAYSAAYFMGADYIEQDVVMTKDDQLVVLHDPYLDRVTDVIRKFPKRFHIMPDKSKRWRAVDFTLAEIKTLQAVTGFQIPDNSEKGKKADLTKADWPERFPLWKSDFEVPTLGEAIELIQGLNQSTGRNVGIYPEVKNPSQFLIEGKDISMAVLKELKKYGYTKKSDKVFVQCFNPIETKRIATELMPKLGMDLKVIQLVAETSWNESFEIKRNKLVPYDFDWMFKPGAMKKIAEYADGIGPWKPFLLDSAKSTRDNLAIKPMMTDAKAAGLVVHPYTFRADTGRVMAPARDFEDMINMFYFDVGVDGLFTDYADRAFNALH
ncbi:glycerophosphodiester phosphodiesterase [Pelagibaculum spongiae]|uniref:glycerophosphodiester phosphodiesterase n=1 Tax=Pelagibaculum spongiae TaxID=2080658 RepID=A0A2V1GNU3_9GAMM|nr:glycerophosphodiester phosphodiesterase [Pelagibaculum spongiae]PVZ63563.1 glycerophosphodiester phosphodiesterase [Pelagibaculum spongiae]